MIYRNLKKTALTSSHMESERLALGKTLTTYIALERPFTCVNQLDKKCLWVIIFSFEIFDLYCLQQIQKLRISLWLTMWDFNDPFWVNEFPQIVQTYGFRPSWVILCRVKFVLVLNVLWHLSQRFSAFDTLFDFCDVFLLSGSYFDLRTNNK